MIIRLSVEIGPTDEDLDQVLSLDVDDLLEVIERLGQGPLEWLWQVPGGGSVRLRAWGENDTPEQPNTGRV